MIGFKLEQAKTMFFDRQVIRGVDRTTARVLSRFGAYVRQAARSSIRKRKRISAAGQPPSSHTGLLKRNIFFGYDRNNRSVLVGPTALNAKNAGIPAVLEYGGVSQVTGYRGRGRRKIKVRARPFMGPALAKEQPKLPDMWKDSIN